MGLTLQACSSNNLQGAAVCADVASSLSITRQVLMTFQACLGTQEECDASDNYSLWLAQSDDLLRWEIVPGWVPLSDRGADLVKRSDTVYLYSDGGKVRYLDLSLGTLSCAEDVELVDAAGTVLDAEILSPAPILSSTSNRIVLGFLDASEGKAGDPATCTSFPCVRHILSAEETPNGLGARFEMSSGNRLVLSLTSENPRIYDPEWLSTGATDGFLFFIPRSDSTLDLFASTTLGATYTSIGQVLEHGTPASFLHDGTQYWEFASTLDDESPQNRVIEIRASDTLSELPSAASTFIFEGIDYPELGGFPIQVKDPAVLMLD